jgi:hypothetical protein
MPRNRRNGTQWFHTFMDETPDVYFRYALVPVARVVYVSRAIRDLTGCAADRFYADARLCLSLVPRDERHILRQLAHARRAGPAAIHIRRDDGSLVPVEIRTVPVARGRRLVAIEGVVVADRGGCRWRRPRRGGRAGAAAARRAVVRGSRSAARERRAGPRTRTG